MTLPSSRPCLRLYTYQKDELAQPQNIQNSKFLFSLPLHLILYLIKSNAHYYYHYCVLFLSETEFTNLLFVDCSQILQFIHSYVTLLFNSSLK